MIRVSVLVLAATLLGQSAVAATVYEQPGTTSCVPECSTSQLANGFGIRTYDNFKLDAAAIITTVTWQGIYFNLLQQFPDPAPLPSTTSWRLEFFGSGAGVPETSLYSTTLSVANVTRTFLGSGSGAIGIGAYNVNYYAFSATLPTAFEAAADTDYWFSPLSLAPDFLTFFLWSPTTESFDGFSWRAGTAVAGGQAVLSDYTFALGAAAAVPEPAGWTMLIAGFGVAGLAARRRRSIAA